MSFWLPQATILWKRRPILIFFIGIGLMLVGVAFRWYSASLLGKYFTFDVAIHSGGQTLIEVGPYRYIRHPSYTGALVSLFGFGLSLGNWAGLVAGVSCLSIAYAFLRRSCGTCRYIDDLELCPYPVACTRKILKYPISGLPTTLPIWSAELLCCG
jgi:protein-S-isoprenylcysteine O-methyltransferase Ste14